MMMFNCCGKIEELLLPPNDDTKTDSFFLYRGEILFPDTVWGIIISPIHLQHMTLVTHWATTYTNIVIIGCPKSKINPPSTAKYQTHISNNCGYRFRQLLRGHIILK